MFQERHVLYAEDHDDNREMLTRLLGYDGLKVTAVSSAAECLKSLESNHYDLILLDNAFPDISGSTLCTLIRMSDKTTPILFFSSLAYPKDREAAINAGAQVFLVKPNDLTKVSATVKRLIDESISAKQPQSNAAQNSAPPSSFNINFPTH